MNKNPKNIKKNQTVVLTILGSSLQDTLKELEGPLGMTRYAKNAPVSQESYDLVVDSLPKNQKSMVRSGEYEVIPRETQRLGDGKNDMEAIDFDIVQNRAIAASDPKYIFRGPDAKRFAKLAKQLLQNPVSIDVLKSGLLHGVKSSEFQTSVQDLAMLKGVSYNQMYDQCIQKIISGSVFALKNKAVPRMRTQQKLMVRP